jgi:hypothetical protein
MKVKSRFTPRDPGAVRARFERVKERAIRRVEEEAERVRQALRAKTVDAAGTEPVQGRRGRPVHRRGPNPRAA